MSAPMRIACVRIPAFPVWAARHQDPALARSALVVGGVPPERGEVRAVSAEAEHQGVHPGMTLSAAQAALPGARFLADAPDLERRERRALEEILRGFTPGVETARGEGASLVAGEGAGETTLFLLDTRGLGRLHATEESFARRVHAAVRARGYPASVGVASSRFVAEAAAIEARGGIKVVRAGGEPRFLAPLGLSVLPFDPDTLDQVTALGVRTLGEWAALPEASVAARFGTTAVRLQQLARGDDGRPLTTTPGGGPVTAEVALDEPVTDLDRLVPDLERAAGTLCRRLAGRGLATTRVRAALALDGHAHVTREARFVRPTLAPRLVLDSLRLALGQKELPAAVVGFTLEAVETVPARAEQLLLFVREHAHADPQAVEQALTRVRALVGPGGVVSPRPADAHRPEAQVRWEPYPGPPEGAVPTPVATAMRLSRVHPQAEVPPGPATAELPARMLAAPAASEVRMLRGRPVFVATGSVRAPVHAADGPHRLGGEWWSNRYDRDYWSLTLADGGRYWVFQDRRDGGWFLHGLFD